MPVRIMQAFVTVLRAARLCPEPAVHSVCCMSQTAGTSPKPSEIAARAATLPTALAADRSGRWLAAGLADGAVDFYVDGAVLEGANCVEDVASPVTALAWGPRPASADVGDVSAADLWPPLAAGTGNGALAVHKARYGEDAQCMRQLSLTSGINSDGCSLPGECSTYAGFWRPVRSDMRKSLRWQMQGEANRDCDLEIKMKADVRPRRAGELP